MKRRREEEKAVGPMFPRLHVNDAGDKGGPRAPPRNKMALYEQLSIPSQRFNPAATSAGSVSPRRRHCSGTLVTSTSSSQGYEHERSIFSPFYVPPHTPTHLGERFHSRCTDEMNLNTSMMELERRSITCVNNTTLNKAGLDAECSLLRPHESSSAKNSSCKKSEDEGDFRVPTFIQSGVTAFSRKDTAMAEPERLTPFYANSPQKSYSAAFNSSIQFPNPTTDMKSVKYGHKQSEENLKEALVVKEPAENSAPHPESGEKFAERSNFATPSSQQDHTNTSNVSQNLCYENPRLGRQSCDNDVSDGPRCLNDIDVLETGETLRVRNELCLKASLGNTINSPNVSYKGNGQSEDKASGSFEMGDAEKTDEASEASMVDSIPSMEISPDDVVGVIGPKQFWKARRAIVNQQRVFAFQVFELHRLIKVQKLMAASPHLLLEGNPCLRRPPTKVLTKRPSPEHMVKSHLQTVKQKDDSKKPSQNTESPAVNPVKATPLPSREDGLSKGFPGQVPRSGPYSGTLPPVSMTPDNSASGWCLHPPPNQWLVPVMSPSEGLVYKPYTGPCPPTGSFVAPIYGSCAPLSLPPVAGDFMNTAYGATSHHQQNMDVLPGAPAIAPNYFPTPYGLPVVNPIISASAVEQVSPLAGSHRHGHAEQHSRSSCNMSNPKSEAFSICPWKFQASKDSELQGSTASSPCEKAREGRDALPLFPMAPTVEGSTQPLPSCCGDNQTRVIKVVPHNARSATESAARIFRSIQEERQQDDL